MQTDKDRLELAKWVLERNLAWIAAAEVKVGVVVAVDTAMLAALGSAFAAVAKAEREGWVMVLTITATTLLVLGLFCAAMAVLPRVSGPLKSLVFFGRIGPMGEGAYIAEFTNATEQDVLRDWLAQVHRNAQIACAKFYWVRKGMLFSFAAILPWLSAIVQALTKAKGG